jgi:Plasmid pRiA4b ORF-3-like protein
MESTDQAIEVYQLRIWIRKISPQIWRRLLVRSDATIAELHETLQVAFGWSDEHLHRFLIRGKPYGIGRIGGIIFDDNPRQVRLCDFHFRCKETWLYADVLI